MKKGLISLATIVALGFAFTVNAETKTAPSTGEFGNHCAMGLVMDKQVETTCAINWTDTTTHKKYCFSTEEAKKQWSTDTKTNISKATTNFEKHAASTHPTKGS